MADASTSTAFGIAAPPQPAPVDYTQYISAAASQLTPGFANIQTAEQNAATVQQQGDQQLASQQQDQITMQQKIYADAASEFNVEQQQETGQAVQQGQAQIGATQVAAARSGVDTGAEGAFAAPTNAAKADLTQAVGNIATKYGVKQEELTDTLSSNVQQLQQKAADYTQQGNQVMADLATTLASQQYSQQQDTVSLAQQMASAENTYEEQSWKDYMDEVNAQHQQETLDVTEERLGQTAQYESEEVGLDQQKVSDTESKTNQATLTDYNKALTAAAKNIKTSSSGTGGITREALIAQLSETYPQLDPKSISDDVYASYPDSYN